MSETVGSKPPAWWQAPAVILAAGCLIALITYGLRTSFSLFLDPLSDGHGWGPGRSSLCHFRAGRV